MQSRRQIGKYQNVYDSMTQVFLTKKNQQNYKTTYHVQKVSEIIIDNFPQQQQNKF